MLVQMANSTECKYAEAAIQSGNLTTATQLMMLDTNASDKAMLQSMINSAASKLAVKH